MFLRKYLYRVDSKNYSICPHLLLPWRIFWRWLFLPARLSYPSFTGADYQKQYDWPEITDNWTNVYGSFHYLLFNIVSCPDTVQDNSNSTAVPVQLVIDAAIVLCFFVVVFFLYEDSHWELFSACYFQCDSLDFERTLTNSSVSPCLSFIIALL